MSGKKMTQAPVAAMRRAFHERADAAFTAMFGPDGHEGLVTFSEREERACREGDALTRWLLEQHLQSDEAAEPPAVVAVHVDAGKVQLRQGEVSRGVHQPHWGDVQVACLPACKVTPSSHGQATLNPIRRRRSLIPRR